MKKIDDEHDLDTKEEMCEEECVDECDSESESEDDRYLLCRMFDSWVHCVRCRRWELSKDYDKRAMIGLHASWVRG